MTVEIVQSAFWMTNSGILSTREGSIVLIDPGVFPHELSAIAKKTRQRPILAAISTHEDWDHVLWSDDFPVGTPRLAHPEIVRLLTEERDAFLHSLERWEDELGVTWDHDLVGRLDPIPGDAFAPGGTRITILPTPGHTPGHTSFWLKDDGILFAGDMLSDVDIPMLAPMPGVREDYLRSLEALEPLLDASTLVIPGHGTPCDRDQAHHRLAMDRMYLDTLTGDAAGVTDNRLLRQANQEAHQDNLKVVRDLG